MAYSDPTYDEMKTYLAYRPYANEANEFDREEAIYWFASHWHSGQTSNLYAALCHSPYDPGPINVGPAPGSMGEFLYSELEDAFGYSGQSA